MIVVGRELEPLAPGDGGKRAWLESQPLRRQVGALPPEVAAWAGLQDDGKGELGDVARSHKLTLQSEKRADGTLNSETAT